MEVRVGLVNFSGSLARILVPKNGIFLILGHPISQGGPQFTQITTIKMDLPIEIRHNILTLCHMNCFEVETLQLYA